MGDLDRFLNRGFLNLFYSIEKNPKYQEKCVNVSQFMSAKPVAKLVMLVGNSTVLNMESSLMVKCLQTRLLETILSAHFSPKLELVNMFLEPFLWIWNLPSSTK